MFAVNAHIRATTETRLRHAALQFLNCPLAQLFGSGRKQTRFCCVESSMLWTPSEVDLIYSVYT